MSLEAAISDLNKNVLSLIETIKSSDALRSEIKEKIETEAKRSAAKAAAPAKAAKTETRQITETPEDRAQVEEKVETKTEERVESKTDEKAPASEELPAEVKTAQEDVATFIGNATSPEDREKRRDDVTGLLTRLKVKRVSELAAADAVRLSGAIAKLTERYAPKQEDDELL